MTRPLSELDHAYLEAHEQSRRLHEVPPQGVTVEDLAHAALAEMLGCPSDAAPLPEGDPT